MDPKTEEFIDLVKASGWSQAEVARQLHITPGGVSQMCSGKIRPRASTLNLFKLILKKQSPRAKSAQKTDSAALEPWERQFLKILNLLPEADRQRFLAMIQAFQASGRRRKR